jgi:hypothetical protein
MLDIWKYVCVAGLCVIAVFGLLGVRGERLKRARTVALLDRAVGLLLGLPLGGVGVLFYTLNNNTTALGQWPWPVIAAFIVLGCGLLITLWHDRRRREQETIDLKTSIYAEIDDFAARCLLDYLRTFRNFTGNLTFERVQNFRPTRPVVQPGVVGKLGLLADDPPLLRTIAQFYFRYDDLKQTVESVIAVCEKREDAGVDGPDPKDRDRTDFIKVRLHSCLAPAFDALSGLGGAFGISEWRAIDAETVRVYGWLERRLARDDLPLREALEGYRRPESEQPQAPETAPQPR